MKILETFSSRICRELYDATLPYSTMRCFSNAALCAFQTFLPCEGIGEQFTEALNKLYAFQCFKNAHALSSVSLEEGCDWPRCVAESSKHDSYTSIWMLEGLACRLVDLHWKRMSEAMDLRNAGAVKQTYSTTKLPLHTGAGIGFALFALGQGSISSEPAIQSLVQCMLNLADQKSLPGYRKCVFEPFGLVVRNLYPQLILPISKVLAAQSNDDYALFWHGSGRGLYFNPLHLLPGLPFRRWSLDEAASNAPAASALANLLSGFFWALTLVNIRHPEVVMRFLDSKSVLNWKRNASAICDGISAGLLVWHHLTGDDAVTEHFLGHVPSGVADGLRRFWQSEIVSFSRCRLTHEYYRLFRDDQIADIFQFQDR